MASNTQRDAERRRAILDAARACFIQFGYAKTSLDDIAKRANLSRPLLYQKYKNKEAIFSAVYADVFEACYPIAENILAGPGAPGDKLFRICEVLCVEPWAMLVDAPMAQEFHAACMQMLPETYAKHERKRLALTKPLLGGNDVAKVFMLAVDGLLADLPSVAVLGKRLRVLVDRFAP